MNRKDVIERMVEQYRDVLEEKDDEELLGSRLEKMRENAIDRLVELYRDRMEDESNEVIENSVEIYMKDLESKTDEELLGASSNKAFVKRMTGGTGILPDGYGDAVEQKTATGFDIEPLPHGDVLMQFLDDDGEAINTQVITKECLARIPVIVHAFFLAVEEGTEEAMAYLDKMSRLELDQFHSSQRNQP